MDPVEQKNQEENQQQKDESSEEQNEITDQNGRFKTVEVIDQPSVDLSTVQVPEEESEIQAIENGDEQEIIMDDCTPEEKARAVELLHQELDYAFSKYLRRIITRPTPCEGPRRPTEREITMTKRALIAYFKQIAESESVLTRVIQNEQDSSSDIDEESDNENDVYVNLLTMSTTKLSLSKTTIGNFVIMPINEEDYELLCRYVKEDPTLTKRLKAATVESVRLAKRRMYKNI